MAGKDIEVLEKKHPGFSDEIMFETELLIRFFNIWPKVQKKWLSELGFNKEQISIILGFSDDYALNKVKMENEKIPKNREEVILIEDKVLRKFYELRVITLNDKSKFKALKTAGEYIKLNHDNAVIFDPETLDDFELMMNAEGRGIDYLIFDPGLNKIIGFQVETKNM